MVTRTSIQEPKSEALAILENLSSALVEPASRFDRLEAHLQRYWKAIRLLGWDESWVVKEMKGYAPNDELPSYRSIPATIKWLTVDTDKEVNAKRRKEYMHGELSPVYEIFEYRQTGYIVRTSEREDGYYLLEKVISISPWHVERVIRAISVELYDNVLNAIVAIKLGMIIESIFRKYQASVEPVLARLGIHDYLKAAYGDLTGKNEASWQNAANACRNIMYSLSEKLWQDLNEVYPYLPDKEKKKPMQVTKDKPRNRIRAYLHQKGIDSDHILVKMVDPLFARASASKNPITYEQAQSQIVLTYVFLGEMVRSTDMKPVKKVEPI